MLTMRPAGERSSTLARLKMFFYIFILECHWHQLHLLSPPLLLQPLSLAPILTYLASKGARGSSWMATSFSFPLMLSSHSAVACSVRAEQTPGSPPEASARRSPPLPAHLREPSEWSAIVLAVIRWPHSTGRQSQEPAPPPPRRTQTQLPPRVCTNPHTHARAHTHTSALVLTVSIVQKNSFWKKLYTVSRYLKN